MIEVVTLPACIHNRVQTARGGEEEKAGVVLEHHSDSDTNELSMKSGLVENPPQSLNGQKTRHDAENGGFDRNTTKALLVTDDDRGYVANNRDGG